MVDVDESWWRFFWVYRYELIAAGVGFAVLEAIVLLRGPAITARAGIAPGWTLKESVAEPSFWIMTLKVALRPASIR